jgi:hypothetical protein
MGWRCNCVSIVLFALLTYAITDILTQSGGLPSAYFKLGQMLVENAHHLADNPCGINDIHVYNYTTDQIQCLVHWLHIKGIADETIDAAVDAALVERRKEQERVGEEKQKESVPTINDLDDAERVAQEIIQSMRLAIMTGFMQDSDNDNRKM